MAETGKPKGIPAGYVQLRESERKAPHTATVMGDIDKHERFSVTIVLRRRSDELPDFHYFTRTPPRARTRFSREDFAKKHGAHPNEIKAVEEFVRNNGLKVESSHAARRHVVVEGTAEQFSKAFAVDLKRYQLATPGRKGTRAQRTTYRGRDGHIHVPHALADSIVGVFGLDNRPMGLRENYPGDAPVVGTLTVQQVVQLYKFPAPGPEIGKQTIGIIAPTGGYGGYLQSDIDKTYSALGLTAPRVIPISVDGVVNSAIALPITEAATKGQKVLTFASTRGILNGSVGQYTAGGVTYQIKVTALTTTTATVEIQDPRPGLSGDAGFPSHINAGTVIHFNLDAETNQDICISSLAAPGAHIAVYFTNNTQKGWVDMIGRVLHPEAGDFRAGVNPPSVLSFSWSMAPGDDPDGLSFRGGDWGTGVTTSVVKAIAAAFQDAAVLQDGPTICVCSGDTGSNCYVGSVGRPAQGDGHAHVPYPASDPWVLSVGGTAIGKYHHGQTNTSAWVEYAWNQASHDPTQPWGTGGGGVSAFFPLPSYQSEAGVPNSINRSITNPTPSTVRPPTPFQEKGRGVPDVAANASKNSGYSGFYLGGVLSPQPGNGTSASAPLWAGLIAMLNSNLKSNVGFANPTLYKLGPEAFNPVNPLWRDPAHPHLAECPANNSNNGIPGYPTGPGWDACTGLGSPNGMALLHAFQRLESGS